MTHQKGENNKHVSCVKKRSDGALDEGSFYTLPVYSDYQERFSAFDETVIHSNKSVTLPVIEPKSEKYSPIPYIFRIHDASYKTINSNARCPPFYIQLDHTIAVIWSMYANEEVAIPLGINQLHWAYSFLQNIKNKDASFPPDVQHCIDSISDELIDQYAEMADDIQIPKTSNMSFNPLAHSSINDEESTNADRTSSKEGNRSGNNDKLCSCKESVVRFSDEVDTCSGTSSTSEACNKQADYPFSVTYNDMKLHNHNLLNKSNKKEEPVCNNATNISDFLNDLRRDQLQKILADLNRLHCIEKYIGTSEEGFEPYLDPDDQSLKEIMEKGFSCINKTYNISKDSNKSQCKKDKSSNKDNTDNNMEDEEDNEAN